MSLPCRDQVFQTEQGPKLQAIIEKILNLPF